jgi:hypothetical protein
MPAVAARWEEVYRRSHGGALLHHLGYLVRSFKDWAYECQQVAGIYAVIDLGVP